MKHYFNIDEDDQEMCYPLKYWKAHIKDNDIKEMVITEAKRVKLGQSDYFFCKAVFEIGEKGDCGKQCEDYRPRNGKSGICKHFQNVYDPTDIKTTIKNPKFNK